MNLFFFTPYAFNKKLLEAYDNYFNLLQNDTDWACFMDGDTLLFTADFGHRIMEYINKYPNTDLFTSYASRCFYNYQVPKEVNQQNDSIRYHHKIAHTHAKYQQGETKKINAPIAGHLLVMQKQKWLQIKDRVFQIAKNETIEGVDTAISKAVLENNGDIMLMKGIYIMHYFRLVEGVKNKKHLGYGMRINIVTPCARPENLKLLSHSINIPKASVKWWVVLDALPNEVDKSLLPPNAEILYHKNKKSVAGHAQRNYALEQIKDGYVYFLDDDTLLHPHFYTSIENLLQHDFIHFDQQNPDGTKRIGGKVEVNHIDTGSAIASRQLIGNTRFRTDAYNADGFFWKAISMKAQRPKYIQKTLSTYNALEKK